MDVLVRQLRRLTRGGASVRSRSNVTLLLAEASAGDRDAYDRLVPLVYGELRAIAERCLRRERPGHTLQPTALVNEAYLKVVAAARFDPLLRSGLALAGVNARSSGEGEDGLLTAREATGLNLWGTKLVVLSACDTGVGEVRTGEGVYGLRRALVLAGAETTMVSLWPVSDKGTRDLMVRFYKRLLEGESRAEALRTTQLKLLESKRYRHPYYWASFIQSGAWGPLDTSAR